MLLWEAKKLPRFNHLLHMPTSEAQLTIANPTILCRALFLMFAATSVPLHALVELAPTVAPSIFLQAFLFGPSILEPDLKPWGRTKWMLVLQQPFYYRGSLLNAESQQRMVIWSRRPGSSHGRIGWPSATSIPTFITREEEWWPWMTKCFRSRTPCLAFLGGEGAAFCQLSGRIHTS